MITMFCSIVTSIKAVWVDLLDDAHLTEGVKT